MIGRRVVFVKYYDKGSTRFCGDQVADMLRARGEDALSIPVAELPRHAGALAVFIKTSRVDHLLRARWAGTTCFLDVQDTPCFKRRIKNARLYAGMIFRSRRQQADLDRPWLRSALILQHWDARYRPHRVPDGEVRVGYLGETRSLALYGRLDDVTFVDDHAAWFDAALDMNVHLSVREPGREWLYKPNTKVSTAAACGAVLVTTPDESALELLGADYPFYVDPTPGSVRAGIDRVRAARGGPEWALALEKLARVKELTRPDAVIDRYVEYLREWG